ncbi:hypothetical protein DX908_13595 [Parvularcula marina]|uniref:Uncharacterized protein n=1 Tax=Parvularcula marina TaxID=2292771 RepID=A0A371RL86_9PROT|nr:hypothetical protein [Parvularcula marina]RFB06207.1 hypothetical protein DX908_13595 [Parvularcula marina]
MRFKPASQPRDIIDDHRMRLAAMGAQEAEHFHHAGAGGEASRHIVGEDLHHLKAAIAGIFPAARFL